MVIIVTRIWYTIIDKPGNGNVIAYFLSQLTNEGDPEPVKDSFPDKHIFALSTHSP